MVAGHRAALMLAALAMTPLGGVAVAVGRRSSPREDALREVYPDHPHIFVDEAAEVTRDQMRSVELCRGYNLEESPIMDAPRLEDRADERRADYTKEPKPRPKRPWTPAADKQLSKAELKRRRKQARRVNHALQAGVVGVYRG